MRFLHLSGDPDVIAERMRARPEHFFKVEMLASQLETLEPLEDDEPGVTADLTDPVEQIIDHFVVDPRTHRRHPVNTAFLTVEPISDASGGQLIAAALIGIAVIVVLITWLKVHPFLALTIGSILTGAVAGAELSKAVLSFSAGVGATVASVGVLIALGAMFGKLLADSGGAVRDRGHDRRPVQRAHAAVGDGAGRRPDRAADVLRDRPGAAGADHPAGRPAVRPAADEDRHPDARRPLGAARLRARRTPARSPRSAC